MTITIKLFVCILWTHLIRVNPADCPDRNQDIHSLSCDGLIEKHKTVKVISEKPLLVITTQTGFNIREEHILSLPSPFHCNQSPHFPPVIWPFIDQIRGLRGQVGCCVVGLDCLLGVMKPSEGHGSQRQLWEIQPYIKDPRTEGVLKGLLFRSVMSTYSRWFSSHSQPKSWFEKGCNLWWDIYVPNQFSTSLWRWKLVSCRILIDPEEWINVSFNS